MSGRAGERLNLKNWETEVEGGKTARVETLEEDALEDVEVDKVGRILLIKG